MCGMLWERRLVARLHPAGNTQQLKQMLNEEWGLLPQKLLDNMDLTKRWLLVTDLVILNHGQVTSTTPELVPPILTTTPHQREDV
ncbi:hypothetical protein TNCV_4001491 [Trichonephila clavipes]|uniref:Uncharacterized protein n=1 Tax=Trichonephila clavipes TaxID=2585209 RepID=A0A8X6RQC1_TRICX|nr:hypothetical protein TNCV_4001491 [Trichonephila clavipes]